MVRRLRTRARGIDDAHERPHHATNAPDPDDLQGDAIDAPEGERPMLVPMSMSMPPEWAAHCAR